MLEMIPALLVVSGVAMTKLANIFMACFIAVVFVVAPTMVSAGGPIVRRGLDCRPDRLNVTYDLRPPFKYSRIAIS